MASRARIGKPAVGFGDNGGMTESAVRHGQAKDTGTLVEGLGRDVLVLKGAVSRLSAFPADVRPRTAAIAILLTICGLFISFYFTTLLSNCSFSESSWDITCYYAMMMWPINILACAMGALLVVFWCSRRVLVTVAPVTVGAVWVVDAMAYIIAAASRSGALWTDTYVQHGAAMIVRDHAIAAMMTATTFAAVYPTSRSYGPLWTLVLVLMRLTGTTANYVGPYGVEWKVMCASIPCALLGSVASVSVMRPSWVFLRLAGVWRAGDVSGATRRSMVRIDSPATVMRRAQRLKVWAWTGMVLSSCFICVSGDWAVRGVIPLFVTMSTVLAFALIRASTLAHEGLHAMQLSTTQKIIGSDANRAHNVSASQSVRQRRATRVVLGSSAHVSSSDSDSGPVGSRQNGRRSTGSKDRKRSPGSVSPLKVSSRSGAGQSRHGVASAGGKDALREWEQNVFGKNAAGAEGEGSVPGRGGAAGSEAAGGEADGLGCDDGEKKEVEGGAGTAEGVCGDAAITRGGDAEQEGRQQDAGETGRVGKGGGGRGQTGGEEAARSHTTKDSVSASGLGVHGLAGKV